MLGAEEAVGEDDRTEIIYRKEKIDILRSGEKSRRGGTTYSTNCRRNQTSEETSSLREHNSVTFSTDSQAIADYSTLGPARENARTRPTRLSPAAGGIDDPRDQQEVVLYTLGVHNIHRQQVGEMGGGYAFLPIADRQTAKSTAGLEKAFPARSLSTSVDRARFPIGTPWFSRPDEASTLVRQGGRTGRDHGGTSTRNQGRSYHRMHPVDTTRLVQGLYPKAGPGQVLRSSSPHNPEREVASGMGHVKAKQLRSSATLQSISGPSNGNVNTERGFVHQHRLQAVLPFSRAHRTSKEFRSSVGGKKRLDLGGFQHSRTSYSPSEHSSIRRKRCSETDGETSPTPRCDDELRRSPQRQNYGRHSDHVSHSARPHPQYHTIVGNNPGARVASQLEEINSDTQRGGSFLRINMVVPDGGRIPPSNQDTTVPSTLSVHQPGIVHQPSLSRKHHRNAQVGTDGPLPSSHVDTDVAAMGKPDGQGAWLGQTSQAITKSSFRNSEMDSNHHKLQRPFHTSTGSVRDPSGRCGGIRIRRPSSQLPTGDPRSLGTRKRQRHVFESARIESGRSNSETFYQHLEIEEYSDFRSQRQHNEHDIHKSVRRQSANTEQSHEVFRGGLLSASQHYRPSLSHSGHRYDRNGSRRIFAREESPVPAEFETPFPPPKVAPRRPNSPSVVQRNSQDISGNVDVEQDVHDRDAIPPSTSVVGDSTPSIVVTTNSDTAAHRESNRRRVRTLSEPTIPFTTRIASLERLQQASEQQYLSAGFARDQLAAARQDHGKIYDMPWHRWVQFSKSDIPNQPSEKDPCFNISVPKFTAFLSAIRDGYMGVKPNTPTYIRQHSSAVLTTLRLAGAIDRSILQGVQQITSTNFHSNIWKDVQRTLAEAGVTRRNFTSTPEVLDEDKCWDPCQLLNFWHNFPSAKSMLAAKWPPALIFILVRAKAVAIVRVECAARSQDITSLTWSRISPRFPVQMRGTTRHRISVQFFNTKADKLRGKFGRLTKPKFLYGTENSNACVITTLNELLATTPYAKTTARDKNDPVFVSDRLSIDPVSKQKVLKALSSERLSNIVRISYWGARIEHFLPRHIRTMSSSKVNAVGIPEKTFLSHCQWTSMATFKKYYKKKFRNDLPDEKLSTFSDALHAGMEFPEPDVRCVKLRENIVRILSLTSRQISMSTKASIQTLQTRFKISTIMIDRAIKAETGRVLPSRKSDRLQQAGSVRGGASE